MNTVILNEIQKINKDSNFENPVHSFLNGYCYIFAKKLQNIFGGNIIYLTDEYHFVLEYNNKLYDASGNVTNKYSHSRKISEQSFLSRSKLKNSIKLV